MDRLRVIDNHHPERFRDFIRHETLGTLLSMQEMSWTRLLDVTRSLTVRTGGSQCLLSGAKRAVSDGSFEAQSWRPPSTIRIQAGVQTECQPTQTPRCLRLFPDHSATAKHPATSSRAGPQRRCPTAGSSRPLPQPCRAYGSPRAPPDARQAPATALPSACW